MKWKTYLGLWDVGVLVRLSNMDLLAVALLVAVSGVVFWVMWQNIPHNDEETDMWTRRHEDMREAQWSRFSAWFEKQRDSICNTKILTGVKEVDKRK